MIDACKLLTYEMYCHQMHHPKPVEELMLDYVETGQEKNQPHCEGRHDQSKEVIDSHDCVIRVST